MNEFPLPYFCPECDSKLVISETLEKYETPAEHCDDPNMEPEERSCLVCKTPGCLACGFWDLDGAYYGKTVAGRKWARDNYIDSSNKDTYSRKGTDALGSLWRKIHSKNIPR